MQHIYVPAVLRVELTDGPPRTAAFWRPILILAQTGQNPSFPAYLGVGACYSMLLHAIACRRTL